MNTSRYTFSGCIFLLMLSTSPSLAQGWLKIIEDPDWWQIEAIDQAPDSSFFLAGERSLEWQLYVAKTDKFGNMLWDKTYFPNLQHPVVATVNALPDGGILVAGSLNAQGGNYADNLYAMRLTGSGEVVWRRDFMLLDNASGEIGGTLLNSDGSFLFTGGGTGSRGGAALLSADGEVLWTKKFQGWAPFKAFEVEDGWLLFGGIYCCPSGTIISKIDKQGNLLWSKEELAAGMQLSDMFQTADGSFAFIARYDPQPFVINSPRTNIGILKTNSELDTLWFKEMHFGDDLPDPRLDDHRYAHFYQSPSGNFFFAGNYYWEAYDKGTPLYVACVSPMGELKWEKTVYPQGKDVDIYRSFCPTQDGGIIAAGMLEPNVPFGNFEDFFLAKFDSLGWLTPSVLKGRLFSDENKSCAADSSEPSLKNWLLRATGENGIFFGNSDETGQFSIGVEPGSYQVDAVLPNSLWKICHDQVLVSAHHQVVENDLAAQALRLCPALTLEASAGRLRRCRETTVALRWCNLGTANAENAAIEVELDEVLIYQSATSGVQSLGGNRFRFPIGLVEPNQCGDLRFSVIPACDAELGQAVCIRSGILTETACAPFLPLAHLRASAECVEGTVILALENDGDTDMSKAHSFEILENDQVEHTGDFFLKKGERRTFLRPANGSTWRLQAEQAASGNTGTSTIASAVEGCVAAQTMQSHTGFLLPLQLDDDDPMADYFCGEITGSFDPNDKQALPKGFGTEHFIEPNTPVKYQIRFQNTGNDTAFAVVIRDTLSTWFDPATFRPGAASHPFDWKISGNGILEFTFPGIRLPDSLHQEPASHGFVSFTISQQPDLLSGTELLNRAAIYFDQNLPVLTAETWLTVGQDFVPKKLGWENSSPAPVEVLPNPFSTSALVIFSGENLRDIQLDIFDLSGRLLRSETHPAGRLEIERGALPGGCYLLELRSADRRVGVGKFVVANK